MISKNDQLYDLIKATQLRLRKVSPFFAALSLFSKVEFINDVPIAATDGIKIYFHPLNFSKLKPSERDAIFLHELLHIALLHPFRKKNRDSLIFNIAADIVVNGMIAELKDFKLPEGAIRDLDLEVLSVEEIYEIIQNRTEFPKLEMIDLIETVKDQDNIKEKDIPHYSTAIEPILKIFKYEKILNARTNLFTRMPNNYSYKSVDGAGLHNDHGYDFKYTTMIYYINTTNGGTYFENGREVQSKENRLVVFDGHMLHRHIYQTDEKIRVATNINIIV